MDKYKILLCYKRLNRQQKCTVNQFLTNYNKTLNMQHDKQYNKEAGKMLLSNHFFILMKRKILKQRNRTRAVTECNLIPPTSVLTETDNLTD